MIARLRKICAITTKFRSEDNKSKLTSVSEIRGVAHSKYTLPASTGFDLIVPLRGWYALEVLVKDFAIHFCRPIVSSSLKFSLD